MKSILLSILWLFYWFFSFSILAFSAVLFYIIDYIPPQVNISILIVLFVCKYSWLNKKCKPKSPRVWISVDSYSTCLIASSVQSLERINLQVHPCLRNLCYCHPHIFGIDSILEPKVCTVLAQYGAHCHHNGVIFHHVCSLTNVQGN